MRTGAEAAAILALVCGGVNAFAPTHMVASGVSGAVRGGRVGGRSSALKSMASSFAPSSPTLAPPVVTKDGKPADSRPKLAKEDEWIANLDFEAVAADFRKLGKKLEADMGEDDMKHLAKMRLWSNAFGAVGLGTMWMTPNPITVMGLSLWVFSRWTMIGHHVCHGGYDKPDTSGRFKSKLFALGTLTNRAKNWFDWMLPEAWNQEHNARHHYFLGELDDPDLVEQNSVGVRDPKTPMPARYAMVTALAASWKWFYYSVNTYKELKLVELKRKNGGKFPEGVDTQSHFMMGDFIADRPRMKQLGMSFTEFFGKVFGPYMVGNFVLRPLPLLLFGPQFFVNGVINLALADVVTNLHGFLTIVTNHAGNDLYRFNVPARDRGTFFLRQIVSSANYKTGGDLNDFMHGFLNYQIEHHLWPNLSMLQYQKAQPMVVELCEKHGIPYVQESVWTRLRKTVDIMVGHSSQRVFPTEYEYQGKVSADQAVTAPALS